MFQSFDITECIRCPKITVEFYHNTALNILKSFIDTKINHISKETELPIIESTARTPLYARLAW